MGAADNAKNAVASWNNAGGVRAVFSALNNLNAVKAMRTAAMQEVARLADVALVNAPTILDGQQLLADYARYIGFIRQARADLPGAHKASTQPQTLEQAIQFKTVYWSWYGFTSSFQVEYIQKQLAQHEYNNGARIPKDLDLFAAYDAAVSSYDQSAAKWDLRRAEIQRSIDLEAARIAEEQARVTAQLSSDVEDAGRVVEGLAEVVQEVALEVDRPDLAERASYWKDEAAKLRERRQAAQAQVLALVDAALAHVVRVEAGGTAEPVDLDTGATKKSGVAPLVLLGSAALLFAGAKQ